MEDYWVFTRMIANGASVVNLPDPLVRYRVDDGAYERKGGVRQLRSELRLQQRLRERGLHHRGAGPPQRHRPRRLPARAGLRSAVGPTAGRSPSPPGRGDPQRAGRPAVAPAPVGREAAAQGPRCSGRPSARRSDAGRPGRRRGRALRTDRRRARRRPWPRRRSSSTAATTSAATRGARSSRPPASRCTGTVRTCSTRATSASGTTSTASPPSPTTSTGCGPCTAARSTRCRSTSARSASSSGPRLGPDQARALVAGQAAELTGTPAQPRGEGDLTHRPTALRGVHARVHRQAVADRPDRAAGRDHHPAAGALHLRQPLLRRPVRGPAGRRVRGVADPDGRPPPDHRAAGDRLPGRRHDLSPRRPSSARSRSSTPGRSTATSTTPTGRWAGAPSTSSRRSCRSATTRAPPSSTRRTTTCRTPGCSSSGTSTPSAPTRPTAR